MKPFNSRSALLSNGRVAAKSVAHVMMAGTQQVGCSVGRSVSVLSERGINAGDDGEPLPTQLLKGREGGGQMVKEKRC